MTLNVLLQGAAATAAGNYVNTAKIVAAVTQTDHTALIVGIFQVAVTSSLVYWVYKTMTKQIEFLTQRIELQGKEIDTLKASENKWFRKYHILANLISKKRCKPNDCTIYQAYNDHLEKEGESI